MAIRTDRRFLLSALVLLLLAGILLAQGEVLETPDRQAVTVDPAALSDLFVDISQLVGPSVVTISSRTTVVTRIPSFPDLSTPFGVDPWEDFFQMPSEQEYTMTGIGSGVIVDSDGLILTNHHVVGEADEFDVVLQNGEEYPGELVGTDPETDVAVISIDAEDLPAIAIGDSDQLRVGQWVLAVGSPFALSQTVTQGIVSYIGRSDVGLAAYEDYIQTDAAINPGNSGGALVDLEGKLVGINTAIASRNGGYQGIGFAIPVNAAVRVMDDLVTHGYVKRGWLGVTIQEMTAGLSEHFGLEDGTGGVLVSQVLRDTPAWEYGLERGDVILSVDDEAFQSVTEFRNLIAERDPGTRVQLDILRNERMMELDVVLGEKAVDESIAYTSDTAEDDFGWTLETLDRRTAESLGDPSLEGVLVTDVEQNSRAANAGVKPGDVLLEVEGFEVSNPDEVRRLTSTDTEILLLVWRQGHSIYFVL
ncbi:MAG: Do family serine endopeptidase [Candidatus Aegiribacteria sp.]|nr:Do family serine endopeptidase [Candidatus Aegiribacteria sp.]MBD3294112.1 Do family serine endopeptidase [Candidatus Fermentibacteria bacterium]